MGAKVDYTKNFIRYSRTETKSITFSEANTKYDLFEATGDCLIKISQSSYASGLKPRFYVNNETTYFAQTTIISNTNAYFHPVKASKYSLTPDNYGNGGPYELVVLLQKGDKLKVDTEDTSGASLTYTILIYE